MKRKEAVILLKRTFSEWSEDKAPRLCAALAYYTTLSLAPFLIICLGIASMVLGDVAPGKIIAEIQGLVGKEAAEAIASMIKARSTQGSSIIATVIGSATLLIAALGLFGSLQDALNTVWGVTPKPGQGFFSMVRARLISFAALLGTAFLLLVSMILSTVLAALGKYMSEILPFPEGAMYLLNLVVSFGVITALFALIYKVLPDAKIAWRDVWIGAAITSMLFVVGKALIGLYLGRGSVASSYGAAGSVVLLLLWVYYSTQILLFGAEFTKVYANNYGSRVVPKENAVQLSDSDRAHQGIPRAETVEKAAKKQEKEERRPLKPSESPT